MSVCAPARHPDPLPALLEPAEGAKVERGEGDRPGETSAGEEQGERDEHDVAGDEDEACLGQHREHAVLRTTLEGAKDPPRRGAHSRAAVLYALYSVIRCPPA